MFVSPHKHLIRNYKNNKYKNKSVLYDKSVHNILMISQMINKNGRFLTYSEYLKTFFIPITAEE